MNICVRGGLAALILCASPAVMAAQLTANATNFKTVFGAARSGDTIKLTGTFGRVSLQGRSFSGLLTIDARAAKFTDTFSFSKVAGVKVLGGNYGNSNASLPGIRIGESSRITFYQPLVSATTVAIRGIDVSYSNNITIDRGTFTGLRLGVGFIGVTSSKIIWNKSIGSASDGFQVADSHNILVSHNSCTGSRPSEGAHPDCVQLWSVKGNKPQSDIEISDNSATGATQGFVSFNAEDGGGDRIKFLRNRVDISYPQGIACYNCRNSVISDNIVTTQAGAKYRTVINVFGGSSNKVTGNTVGERPAAKAPPGKAEFGDFTAARLADFTDFAGFTDADFANNDEAAADFADARRFAADEVDAGALPSIAAVPEPGSWLLMIAGFGLTGALARRRRRVVAA